MGGIDFIHGIQDGLNVSLFVLETHSVEHKIKIVTMAAHTHWRAETQLVAHKKSNERKPVYTASGLPFGCRNSNCNTHMHTWLARIQTEWLQTLSSCRYQIGGFLVRSKW